MPSAPGWLNLSVLSPLKAFQSLRTAKYSDKPFCSGGLGPGLSKLGSVAWGLTCGYAACCAERLYISGAIASRRTSSAQAGRRSLPACADEKICGKTCRKARGFPHSGAAEPRNRPRFFANLDRRGLGPPCFRRSMSAATTNSDSTQQMVVGQFDVEAALRRYMAR